MSMWFERRAGSEESLLVLYDAVQAAEELDLEEQARAESVWASTEPEENADLVEDADSDAVADPPDDDRVTMAQAIGIVEHLLGGHSVP